MNLVLAAGDGGHGGGGLPALPSRDQMIQIKTTGMQNDRLFWECVLTSPDMNQAQRLEQYAAKRAAGDECVMLVLSWRYDPCGFAGRDLWDDLPTMRQYIIEALDTAQGGMKYVLLMLAGDGLSYSPEGGTYGFFNLMDNFQRIYNGLKGGGSDPDLTPYIVWCPGFDGVVPAWAGPEDQWTRQEDWLLHARDVVGPDGVIALELSAGYPCWTEGISRYSSPGGQCLDVILYEFPVPFGPVMSLPIPSDFCNQPDDVRAEYDQCWQISKRLLGSKWKRPSDQPACDDPGMAPDLPGTPRGPYAKVAFEFLTYEMVRNQMSPQLLADVRAYIKGMGWEIIG